MTEENRKSYWRTNLIYLVVLLSIWFVVSYGCGILFAEELNSFRAPMKGFPLGFWFAQQGSIYVFVVIIFAYAFLMNRLDQKYDLHERDEAPAGTPNTGETKVEIDDIPNAED